MVALAAVGAVVGWGRLVVEIDVGFSNCVENLETAFMVMYRGTYGRYSITFDGIFMAPGANERGLSGFGVGSDPAWQGIATLRWQATPSFGVLAAYRYIQIDCQNGTGNEAFIQDVPISGPGTCPDDCA